MMILFQNQEQTYRICVTAIASPKKYFSTESLIEIIDVLAILISFTYEVSEMKFLVSLEICSMRLLRTYANH